MVNEIVVNNIDLLSYIGNVNKFIDLDNNSFDLTKNNTLLTDRLVNKDYTLEDNKITFKIYGSQVNTLYKDLIFKLESLYLNLTGVLTLTVCYSNKTYNVVLDEIAIRKYRFKSHYELEFTFSKLGEIL
ncbi:MAG: hypothetical protein LBM96_00660 [Methanobrevibacter sp.]|jgi:hypothetical protein|nr:hypothetical protein [Candidatus Methanoflexus mossambicus]